MIFKRGVPAGGCPVRPPAQRAISRSLVPRSPQGQELLVSDLQPNQLKNLLRVLVVIRRLGHADRNAFAPYRKSYGSAGNRRDGQQHKDKRHHFTSHNTSILCERALVSSEHQFDPCLSAYRRYLFMHYASNAPRGFI
jgi:hypothetical protein